MTIFINQKEKWNKLLVAPDLTYHVDPEMSNENRDNFNKVMIKIGSIPAPHFQDCTRQVCELYHSQPQVMLGKTFTS